nr:SHOCT domain-containing protein [Modestobacter excelsi]
MDELGKLAELRAAGAVSQEEFDEAKARILKTL